MVKTQRFELPEFVENRFLNIIFFDNLEAKN